MAATFTLAIGAGVAIKHLGFPGDLPNAIECVYKLGCVPMEQTLPIIVVSLISIAAGVSVGPKAPLVVISSSVMSWLSINYFKHDIQMTRICTIIGMSAGLSALFGVQLGGETHFILWPFD